jgi:hypothetical protein
MKLSFETTIGFVMPVISRRFAKPENEKTEATETL